MKSRKTLVALLVIIVGVGILSAGPLDSNQIGIAEGTEPCSNGNCQGFGNNMICCLLSRLDVQEAVDLATHPRYTDDEAIDAMGMEDPLNSLNHRRYDDADAIAAVGPPGLTGYQVISDVFSGQGAGGSLIPQDANFDPNGLVECPCDKVAVGGGGRILAIGASPGPSNLFPLVESRPKDNGWLVIWGSNLFQIYNYDVEVFVIWAERVGGCP